MTEAQAKKEALNRVDKNICYKFAEKEGLDKDEYYEDTISGFTNLIWNGEIDNDEDCNIHNKDTKKNFLDFKEECDRQMVFDKKKDEAIEKFLQELLKINKNYFLGNEEGLIPLGITKNNGEELLSPIACQIFSVIAYEQHINDDYGIKPAIIDKLVEVLKKYSPKKMHEMYDNKSFIRNGLKELDNEELIHLDHPDGYFLSYLTFFGYARA